MGVLVYIQNLDIFLEECYRVLRQEGYLIVSVMNKNSHLYLVRTLLKHSKYPNTMSLRNFKKILEKNGFGIKMILGYNWIPFTRASNSNILPLFSSVERYLKLGLLTFISPLNLIMAEKGFEVRRRLK